MHFVILNQSRCHDCHLNQECYHCAKYLSPKLESHLHKIEVKSDSESEWELVEGRLLESCTATGVPCSTCRRRRPRRNREVHNHDNTPPRRGRRMSARRVPVLGQHQAPRSAAVAPQLRGNRVLDGLSGRSSNIRLRKVCPFLCHPCPCPYRLFPWCLCPLLRPNLHIGGGASPYRGGALPPLPLPF